MKLFIANTSKQAYRFSFRMPETGRIIELPVAIGGQILALDADKAVIDAAIEHHAIYGMKSVQEARSAQGFVGQVYSVDKEISGDLIATNFIDNDAALTEAAEIQRKIEAAAIAGSMSGAGVEAKTVTVETSEVAKSGEPAKNASVVVVDKKVK